MAHGPATWLPIAQLAATLLLGCGAFAIAYQQWRTSNEKLKLDFYDRRDETLNAVLKDLNELIKFNQDHRCNIVNTYALMMRMRTFFSGDTEEILDEIMHATKIYIDIKDLTAHEDRKNFEYKESHDKACSYYKLVTRVAPRLQASAFRDMKVEVPAFPFDFIIRRFTRSH